jgi:hypothetical protein
MVEVDNRGVARMALEQVCARGDMTLAPQCGLELLRALGIVRTLLVAPRFVGPLRRRPRGTRH